MIIQVPYIDATVSSMEDDEMSTYQQVVSVYACIASFFFSLATEWHQRSSEAIEPAPYDRLDLPSRKATRD